MLMMPVLPMTLVRVLLLLEEEGSSGDLRTERVEMSRLPAAGVVVVARILREIIRCGSKW